MSELEMPSAAYEAGHDTACRSGGPSDSMELIRAVIDSAAPIIMAVKLRTFAARLKRVAGFEDGLRPGLLEAARIAIEEANELDPEEATQ